MMREWLGGAWSSGAGATPASVLGWRIGAALVLGGVVAGLYRWARRGESVPATFLTTLVMLATLIAMATQVIGDDVARAFSLVGALSVVRFRTVVKDTQDTAFVIFAVVVGMAAGAGQLAVAVVGLGVLGPASLLLWPPGRSGAWRRIESSLAVRVTSANGTRAAVESALAACTDSFAITSVAMARKGQALDLSYRVRLRPGGTPLDLVAELSRIEGVDDVELRLGG
jgi:hypothetical protein